jgi:hypothetical protein
MKELGIPITRKQHDVIAQRIAKQADAGKSLEAAKAELIAACDAILAGLDDEPAESGLKGVRQNGDVYELVLLIPEPPQAAE